MLVRLTFITANLSEVEKLKQIYMDEIMPVVKAQNGNVGVRLFEPLKGNNEFVSATEWETAADADAYENSGTYSRLVGLLKGMYAGKPVLKSFSVAESNQAVLS